MDGNIVNETFTIIGEPRDLDPILLIESDNLIIYELFRIQRRRRGRRSVRRQRSIVRLFFI